MGKMYNMSNIKMNNSNKLANDYVSQIKFAFDNE